MFQGCNLFMCLLAVLGSNDIRKVPQQNVSLTAPSERLLRPAWAAFGHLLLCGCVNIFLPRFALGQYIEWSDVPLCATRFYGSSQAFCQTSRFKFCFVGRHRPSGSGDTPSQNDDNEWDGDGGPIRNYLPNQSNQNWVTLCKDNNRRRAENNGGMPRFLFFYRLLGSLLKNIFCYQ